MNLRTPLEHLVTRKEDLRYLRDYSIERARESVGALRKSWVTYARMDNHRLIRSKK